MPAIAQHAALTSITLIAQYAVVQAEIENLNTYGLMLSMEQETAASCSQLCACACGLICKKSCCTGCLMSFFSCCICCCVGPKMKETFGEKAKEVYALSGSVQNRIRSHLSADADLTVDWTLIA